MGEHKFDSIFSIPLFIHVQNITSLYLGLVCLTVFFLLSFLLYATQCAAIIFFWCAIGDSCNGRQLRSGKNGWRSRNHIISPFFVCCSSFIHSINLCCPCGDRLIEIPVEPCSIYLFIFSRNTDWHEQKINKDRTAKNNKRDSDWNWVQHANISGGAGNSSSNET